MSDDATGAAGIVSNKFHTAQNYAQDAWLAAETFLSKLGEVSKLEYPYARIASAPESPHFSDLPAPPGAAAPTLKDVAEPDSPVLTSLDLEHLEIPDFTVAPPDIFLPAPPEGVWPEAPGEAPGLGEIDLPADPAVVLPDPPRFDPVDIPDMPGPITQAFEGQRPPSPAMAAPGNLFVHEEGAYVSPLRDALRDRLQSGLEAGGAGLGAEVEQAFWELGRDRFREELEARLEEISASFAARNCSRPPGPMQAMIGRAYAEYSRRLADLDKEIMVEEARTARQDGQFYVDKALSFEAQQIELFNRTAERAFERARAVAQFGYEALNAEVNLYNAQLAAYQADAAVFEARIRAGLAELQTYKTRMEGASLAADIQSRSVELYTAQLAGATALIETYKARIQGAAVKAETQKQRIMAYESQVQAYVAGINANTAGYNAYAARIAGEEAKARVYGEQVKAWSEYVKAAKSESELLISARTEENRLVLEKYKVDVGKYEARVRKAVSEAELLLRGSEAEIKGYEALVGARGVEIDARSKEYAGKVDAYLKSAEVSIKEADMLLQNSLNEMRLEAEKIKSGAQVSAQMAASALSSVNASAAIGYTESKGERSNTSVTESTQRSSSESTTRSSGFRESVSHNYNYRT